MTEKEAYGSAYLYADDLPRGQQCPCVIAEYHPPGTLKTAQGEVIPRSVIVFEKSPKRLVLCRTNYRILRCLLGIDEKKWIGAKVSLEVRILANAMGQKDVPCIRITIPEKDMSKISYSLRNKKVYGEKS